MHVDTHGQGSDLVLLHGWAMHGGIFHSLLPRLRSHYRVHVVDLPGHGLSRGHESRFELHDIVYRLKYRLPRAVYVGWSLGGLIALSLALEHPEHVAGLGMIAAAPSFVRRADDPHGVDLTVFEQFRDDLASNYKRTIERFLALEVVGDEHAQSCLRSLKAHIFDRGEPDPHVLHDGLNILAHTDLNSRLSRINCPSVWIAGARDRLVSVDAVERAAMHCRGHFLRFDHAGHAPFLTHAERVERALEDLMIEAEGA